MSRPVVESGTKSPKKKSCIVSFDKINIKSGLLFVYQQTTTSNKILRKAEPIKTK